MSKIPKYYQDQKEIYLDYAATTPIDSTVLEEMIPYLKQSYGNPSSIHSLGQEAKVAVDKARERVANFLNCSSNEIIFTGSATEANNLAIQGLIKALTEKNDDSFRPHIITSAIEHHAVLHPVEQLEKRGLAEATYLPVDNKGLVETSQVKQAIKDNTVLISIMYANNEIGTIEPIAEIANIIKGINSSNNPALPAGRQHPKSNIYFHTDAVQAINYLNCDVEQLGVDLLTLSAHKIYGPKGVGALYVKKGTPLEPLIYGGGHEHGLRSGTENVAGIVGLGAAVEEVSKSKENKRIKELRDKLIEGALKISNTELNGSKENRLPNNVNVSISGVEGESLVISLDQEGIAASTGSACSTKTLEPSHVLLALGLSPKQAHGSLRLTLGKYTKQEEIDAVLKVLPKIVKRLRKISPF